jgi:hypothetical protein
LSPSAESADAQRDALTRELRDVEHAQTRLIDAITTAGDVAALAAALKQKETSRAHLTRALAALEQRAKAGRIDPRRIEQDLVKRLTEWHKLLGQHTPIARQIVLKLVKDGRLVFTPKPEAGVYEFEGLTVLDKLLAGVIPQDHAVPQVWRALQDSNLRPPGSYPRLSLQKPANLLDELRPATRGYHAEFSPEAQSGLTCGRPSPPGSMFSLVQPAR